MLVFPPRCDLRFMAHFNSPCRFNAVLHSVSDLCARMNTAFACVMLAVTLGCGGKDHNGTNAPKPVAPASDIVHVVGPTMGTRYEVKIANPPADLPKDWRLQIERELRSVNDQMSTYLRSSEISRFNASESSDWFAVSEATAKVVSAALSISQQTDGAFDVTVGPLVDLWSFGPGQRKRVLPDDSAIDAARAGVGWQALHARLDQPALKKDRPELRVDLSSIAKGHGVDRIVMRLTELNCHDIFVNIGGEIAARGDKGSAGPWRAGIERPDEIASVLLFPIEVHNEAVATSGDYRNYFEVDGRRYSHTIDPRTGRPVTHQLASVSVVADSCMIADGWATALNVLGPEQGVTVARANNIDAFLLQRRTKAFVPHAVGRFEAWSQSMAQSDQSR